MSETLRDLVVGINFDDVDIATLLRVDDVMDQIENDLAGMTGDLTKSLKSMTKLGSAADGLADGFNDAAHEMDDVSQNADDLTDDLKRADREMDDLVNGSGKLGKEIGKADSKADALHSTFKKVAGILGTVFAIDKVKDFGLSIIESAASAKAMNAQFEQVFEEMQGEATETMNRLGESFGMVPERLKPALSQTTSMFKGLGLETGDAMFQAEKAVTMAADAAAFYDKSYEDANSSLMSFVKGNYEGGESIGLFANETQLASWAARELDVDWKKLGEADKQMARLEFARTMQEAAKVTGQAARESDSYENQLGNLKQTWQNFKALLGGALLQPFVDALQDASEWLSGLDPAQIEKIADFIATTFVEGIQLGKDAFDVLNDTFQWLLDNKDPIIMAGAGILGAIVAFQTISTITGAIATFNTLLAAYRSGTLLATAAQMGFNTALLTNPITWVALAIGVLIAAGVALYMNWDTVKTKATELWATTKEVFGNFYDWGMAKIQPVTQFFSDLSAKFGEFKEKIMNFKLPDWVSSIGSKIGGAVSKLTGNNNPMKDGSHATGLETVPFDGYMAELHKDEAVLTATQSDALRAAGVLSSRGNRPVVDLNSQQPETQFVPTNSAPTPGNATFAPNITITVDGTNGQLDEKMIAQLAAEETQRQLEKFWRQMNMKHA